MPMPDIRDIAAEWDTAVRAAVPAFARLVPEAETRGSVLRPGASESELVIAETRLGIKLPEPYRSFLRISNGADAGPLGADTVHRVWELPRCGLLPAAEVDHFEQQVPRLMDIWREGMAGLADKQTLPTDEEPVDVVDFSSHGHALNITVPEQDNIVALVEKPGHWQVWEFAHTEVIAHRSFAAFLQAKTRTATEQINARTVRLAADRYRNPRQCLSDLADAGDPLAVEIACSAFREPSTPDEQQFAATRLRMIGDPRALPVLQAALRTELDPSVEVLVLFALDSCGDADAIPRLQRLVGIDHPRASWAAGYLERRHRCTTW